MESGVASQGRLAGVGAGLGAGKMELLMILTSPLWPLALLAAVDRARNSSPPLLRGSTRMQHQRRGFRKHEEEPEPRTVEPPAFLLEAANLPDIVADRAMRSYERARRMGMTPNQHLDLR